jgi:hypothetical protein
MMGTQSVAAGSTQTNLDVSRLTAGYYWIEYYDGSKHSRLGLFRE